MNEPCILVLVSRLLLTIVVGLRTSTWAFMFIDHLWKRHERTGWVVSQANYFIWLTFNSGADYLKQECSFSLLWVSAKRGLEVWASMVSLFLSYFFLNIIYFFLSCTSLIYKFRFSVGQAIDFMICRTLFF